MRSTPLSGMLLTLTTPMDGLSRRFRRPSKHLPRKLMSNSRKAGERKSQKPSSTLTLTNQVKYPQLSLKPPSRNTDTQTSLTSLPRQIKNAKKEERKVERKKKRNENPE